MCLGRGGGDKVGLTPEDHWLKLRWVLEGSAWED